MCFLAQDMEKTERMSKRMQELETVNNNIKLLTEMLQHYNRNSSTSDVEILKVCTSLFIPIRLQRAQHCRALMFVRFVQELYDSLEKRRPTLFRMASETDEKENDAMSTTQ